MRALRPLGLSDEPDDDGAPEDAMGAAQWTWVAAGLVVTAFWAAVSQWGDGSAPVDTTAMGAAAAAGTAALVAAGWVYRPDGSVLVAGATLALLPMAVAASSVGSAAGFLVVVLFLLAAGDVVVEVVRGQVESLWASAAVLAGAVLLLGGMLTGPGDPGRWALPSGDQAGAALALSGAAVLLAAAAFGPPRLRCVAGAGALVAVVAAGGVTALAVTIAGGAMAVAGAALFPHRPSLVLGFLGLAAAGYGPTRPAGILLVSAAVLVLTLDWDHPGLAVLGVPGGAALASGLVGSRLSGEAVALALSAALAAAALLFWLSEWRPARASPFESRLWWRALPGLALAAWLLVAPGSWEWTGLAGAGPYDRGAAVAAGVGVTAVVLRRAIALSNP